MVLFGVAFGVDHNEGAVQIHLSYLFTMAWWLSHADVFMAGESIMHMQRAATSTSLQGWW